MPKCRLRDDHIRKESKKWWKVVVALERKDAYLDSNVYQETAEMEMRRILDHVCDMLILGGEVCTCVEV